MGVAIEGAARSSEVTRGVRPSVSLTGEPVKLVPRTPEFRAVIASSCEIHVIFYYHQVLMYSAVCPPKF